MKPLHSIPKEIAILIPEIEQRGASYLYTLGYTTFRRHENHWDVHHNSETDWTHNIDLGYWGRTLPNVPRIPFNMEWIVS